MNQSNQQILIVEVRTVDYSAAEYDLSQTNNLIVHRDRYGKHHLSLQQLGQLKTAIIEIIPRLGSNYRHPLLL